MQRKGFTNNEKRAAQLRQRMYVCVGESEQQCIQISSGKMNPKLNIVKNTRADTHLNRAYLLIRCPHKLNKKHNEKKHGHFNRNSKNNEYSKKSTTWLLFQYLFYSFYFKSNFAVWFFFISFWQLSSSDFFQFIRIFHRLWREFFHRHKFTYFTCTVHTQLTNK